MMLYTHSPIAQQAADSPSVRGWNMPIVRGDAAKAWWAYNTAKTPEAFHESLDQRGLHLARVTAEDARDSHTHHWAAKRQGRYQPILREGEYIAVSERGQGYRLDERSLGHELREVKAFMSGLDGRPMPSLREVQNAVHEKRTREINVAQDGSCSPRY